MADCPRFIVIESLEEFYLSKFSLFLIAKVILRATPRNVKKHIIGTCSSWWTARDNLKTSSRWRAFIWPNIKHNHMKDWTFQLLEVGSWNLLTVEEMTAALEKQGLTNIERNTIRKGGEQIQTDIYILIFNRPHILKEVTASRE